MASKLGDALSMMTAPKAVVLQPDTLCNIDCGYCYLPFRKESNLMSREVADAVAASIEPWTARGPVEICWHGGEPLAVGRERLGHLMDAFAGLDVVHQIQTNAMLISEAWCDFFDSRGVQLGISLDGWAEDNTRRLDRRGKATYARVMKSVDLLHDRSRSFSCISVVSNPTPERARRLYDFACLIAPSSLGVNIEENEGVNAVSNEHDVDVVIEFWAELFAAWSMNPVVPVRELDRVLSYVSSVLDDAERPTSLARIDPLPTVSFSGDVTLISPEFAGFTAPGYEFALGNVITSSLDEVIARSSDSVWVNEFMNGVRECSLTCPYFGFCGGGHPSNRYFETGKMGGTETNYCRNSKIALMEGVLRE